jgi:hypothetical protein
MTQSSGLLSTLRRGWEIQITTHPERPKDSDQLAKSIIDIATGEPLRDSPLAGQIPFITHANCFISALGTL